MSTHYSTVAPVTHPATKQAQHRLTCNNIQTHYAQLYKLAHTARLFMCLIYMYLWHPSHYTTSSFFPLSSGAYPRMSSSSKVLDGTPMSTRLPSRPGSNLGHPSSHKPSAALLNLQQYPATLRVAVKASSYSKAVCVAPHPLHCKARSLDVNQLTFATWFVLSTYSVHGL